MSKLPHRMVAVYSQSVEKKKLTVCHFRLRSMTFLQLFFLEEILNKIKCLIINIQIYLFFSKVYIIKTFVI